MRRRTLLVALAGLAVVVAVGVVVLWPRADRITEANFERIRVGMSRTDVEAILGPPGDFRTDESIVLEPPTTDRTVPAGSRSNIPVCALHLRHRDSSHAVATRE